MKTAAIVLAAMLGLCGPAMADSDAPAAVNGGVEWAGTVADVSGVWVTSEGKAHIDLEACGTDLCGTVVWLKIPIDPETNAPKLDKRNPDPALRSRPIIGLPILDLRPASDGQWHGEIYNAEDGNTYDAVLRGDGTNLHVEGCAFFGLLCRTQDWVHFKE